MAKTLFVSALLLSLTTTTTLALPLATPASVAPYTLPSSDTRGKDTHPMNMPVVAPCTDPRWNFVGFAGCYVLVNGGDFNSKDFNPPPDVIKGVEHEPQRREAEKEDAGKDAGKNAGKDPVKVACGEGLDEECMLLVGGHGIVKESDVDVVARDVKPLVEVKGPGLKGPEMQMEKEEEDREVEGLGERAAWDWCLDALACAMTVENTRDGKDDE
ncbi:hypothetical protein H2199_005125 [Coniosporium tulheliwenetii]|nr:hypothetical protein H2199_005125 [Cladosporium sp. JES 115]